MGRKSRGSRRPSKPRLTASPPHGVVGAGRKASSARWLRRQAADPFVRQAKAAGLRSRAAFKLTEIDERLHLFSRGRRVVDLGAAPGGWSQVAAKGVGAASAGGGTVIAVDLAPVAPIPGVTFLESDVEQSATAKAVMALLGAGAGAGADAVLSDMAPAATGHRPTDHARTVALAEAAYAVALGVLKPGGTFVVKVTQGGAEAALLAGLKNGFRAVRHFKPRASRPESPETYVVATGFRGPPARPG